jgi:hypothetical protein
MERFSELIIPDNSKPAFTDQPDLANRYQASTERN